MIRILFIIYLLGTPLLLMLLARRWRWINAVSPMTLLYIIGLAVANTVHFTDTISATCTMVGNVAVPLAIPLMLMSCDVRCLSWRKAGKVFLSGLAAVLIVSVGGYFLFRHGSDDIDFARVCAVATGIYTGGIPNMGAVAKGVELNGDSFLYLTSYDLIATGLYLVFIIFAGKQVFRKLLGSGIERSKVSAETVSIPKDKRRNNMLLVLQIVAAVIIAAASFILAMVVPPKGEVNMTVLILALTTLAIGVGLLLPARQGDEAFNIGLYLVYLFCFSIANSCDVSQMDIGGSLNILGYVLFVIFGSLVLQILMAKWLKIDGDTVMVASVALINSPPFVPMVAALLGNRDVMVVGISIGLLGYMIGNYIGIAVYHLLTLF
ncbi:MAG: DUF819 family protein [Bacteroidales bacterium]|nr:DUF819 family protein [Bacteroidales bacterium]